jgi:hypothetical protein
MSLSAPTLGKLRPGSQTGPLNHNWRGDAATYGTAHTRIRVARGPAKQHRCVDCGRRADDWSYDGGDPDERRDPRFGAYSLDVWRYQPRCRNCHRRHDGLSPLDVETVREILLRWDDGESQAALCRWYGLSPAAMCNLVHRRSWPWVRTKRPLRRGRPWIDGGLSWWPS